METPQNPNYYYPPRTPYQGAKRFFTYMAASMVGFILTIILFSLIMFGIIATIVSVATTEEVKIASNSILHIKLDKAILDRSPKTPFHFEFGGISQRLGLNDILKEIKRASDDDRIKGIFLDLSDIDAGISTTSEIRSALSEFRKSGKFVLSYSEAYSQSAYYLASVADTIYVHPQGMLLFKGLNAELTFLKGTLEKLDIQMQIIRHGKFKAATEPLFLDKMSPENRLQINALIKNTWNSVVSEISESRKISVERLNQIADSLVAQEPEAALAAGLIDRIAYRDEVNSVMKIITGIEEKKEPKFITIEKYAKTDNGMMESSGNGKIAVIYAIGNVMGGEGDDETIGSDRIAKALRKARLDDKVKAIVFRINSPGGSALASDVIWREVDLAAKKKPVVASLGDVAASGGYYIACPATRIIADPTTITGSIGVFGVIPNMQGFFNKKLGITFDEARTNANSDYISVVKPLSTYQKAVLQKEIESIYTAFTSKVAAGRNMTVAQVDSIGQGRVWSAVDAQKIGLVDELGGIETAISAAAKLAKLENYKLISLPEQKDPWQTLLEDIMGEQSSSVIRSELGEDYRIYQYIKEIRAMKGIQARMLYDIRLN